VKPLHWAFILVAIIFPVSIICRSLVNNRFIALKDEVRINNAIDTATQDAVEQIIAARSFLGNTFEYDNIFGYVIDVTPSLAQESINTFFHTMAVNYNIPYKMSDTTELYASSTNSYIKNYFASYVPAVIVIAYDGFYVYSIEQDESNFYGYHLSSKIPYTVNMGEYTIGYTLGDDIYLYLNPNDGNIVNVGKCYSGKLHSSDFTEIEKKWNDDYAFIAEMISEDDDLTDRIASLTDDIDIIIYSLTQVDSPKIRNNIEYIQPSKDAEIPFLQDFERNEKGELSKAGKFHDARRTAIISMITETLNTEFNEHNNFADLVGITYNFTLPVIPDDEWINSINDISVMAFVQGIPMGTSESIYFNSYALGGSQIVRSEYLYGKEYENPSTHLVTNLYHRKNCPLISGDSYTNIFINRENAMEQGYVACQLCNK